MDENRTVVKRNLLTDIGLGAWTVFLPLIMTLGTLGEGHYARSVFCAVLTLSILATLVGLIRAGTAGYRKRLICLSAALPLSMVIVAFGHLGTMAVFLGFAVIAVGVGMLLKKLAES